MIKQPDNLCFIQMSGVPGSGKTTIATALGKRIGAAVIDHDVTKTALLEADVPIGMAGKASYYVLNGLARHLLSQGHSVIFDSPCLYDVLIERGQRLAAEANATYRFIECRIDDLAELDRRIRSRPGMRSQRRGVNMPPVDVSDKPQPDALFHDWLLNMKRPEGDYLVLDTTKSSESCIEEAVAYLAKGA